MPKFLVVILATLAYAAPQDEPFPELPCLSFGGFCVKSENCPEGMQYITRGLCPLQQSRGVQCCYGLPRIESRCQRKGGQCAPNTSQCPEFLIDNSECGEDQKCCVLVRS